MIHLTFDQDWAPPWATERLAADLRAAGQRGTLFVTNACAALAPAAADGTLELGLHPNFLPGSSHGATTGDVLDHVATLAPGAIGVRPHCLVTHTPLRLEYGRRGLLYESADLMDGVENLAPLALWTGLVRFPIFWEDDVHLSFGRDCSPGALRCSGGGLRVLNFHPVLLALNASDLAGYGALKASLAARGVALAAATEEDFAPHVSNKRGVRDLLADVLELLSARPDQAGGTLREGWERFTGRSAAT
ncbi:MAG: hypothetical protein H6697_01155 [Myxococcales bacterium]|nr:hypothetical protein [Myxococcales bacterium]MCB9520546.1 hypothetical protein [Myxococcales bacterium]